MDKSTASNRNDCVCACLNWIFVWSVSCKCHIRTVVRRYELSYAPAKSSILAEFKNEINFKPLNMVFYKKSPDIWCNCMVYCQNVASCARSSWTVMPEFYCIFYRSVVLFSCSDCSLCSILLCVFQQTTCVRCDPWNQWNY